MLQQHLPSRWLLLSTSVQNLQPYANWIPYQGKDFMDMIKNTQRSCIVIIATFKLRGGGGEKCKEDYCPPDPTNCTGFCTMWENGGLSTLLCLIFSFNCSVWFIQAAQHTKLPKGREQRTCAMQWAKVQWNALRIPLRTILYFCFTAGSPVVARGDLGQGISPGIQGKESA